LSAALAAYPPLYAGRLEALVAAPGIGACAIVLAVLVFRWEPLVPWAIVLLGTAYAGSLFAARAGLDVGAPVYGACLLLLSELVTWSVQERVRVHVELRVAATRAGAIVATCVLGAAAGYVALSATGLRTSGGLLLEAAGVTAAVVAVASVTRATR
jgi:hypothetical protein